MVATLRPTRLGVLESLCGAAGWVSRDGTGTAWVGRLPPNHILHTIGAQHPLGPA